MTPRELRTAGWVNKRRSGQRRGYCDRGLRSTEFPGRCTRIGRTSISGSPRKESACKERRPRRSSEAGASGWRSASSRQIHRKRKVAWSATTGYIKIAKKLRRKGIQDYEAANAYLEAEYLPEHNRRFAREAARPEDYHVRTPSAARLREVFRLETERWISNDWVVQYRGHFLQLKPQNRRYGPTRSKALICEWEDGAVEVRYRDERIEYEDLVLRPSVVTAPKAKPHREPAKHGRTKPAPNHPWREGHAERRKQLLLDRTQMSALIGASASASP